jgi:hypothetical protein
MLSWAHISGSQTPGLTRGSTPRIWYKKGGKPWVKPGVHPPPHLVYKRGRVNPGLNPGLDVLRFGLWKDFGTLFKELNFIKFSDIHPMSKCCFFLMEPQTPF